MAWHGSGTLVATCGGGAEEILSNELAGLGLAPIGRQNGSVRFKGAAREMMLANLSLRTASRVLVPILTAPVSSYDEVYQVVHRLPWQKYLPSKSTFSVSLVTRDRELSNRQFAAMRLKDAIVDKQRKLRGNRSDVDRTQPDLFIVAYISEGNLELSFDSSGTPLHERGYRTEAVEAPLRETVAAAILLCSQWPSSAAFWDPMCGSGTFCIEAALIARNYAPGLLRKGFAFLRWPGVNRGLYQEIRSTLENQITDPAVNIRGSDKDPQATEIAIRNAQRAGVDGMVQFQTSDIESVSGGQNGGYLVMNPPYGERLDLPEERLFYSSLSQSLKNNFPGWNAFIFTANRQGMKAFSLRTKVRAHLYNGALETLLYHADIYGAREDG